MSKKRNISPIRKEARIDEQYELNRENTLVSQSGLITAIFSFSTTALFTVWELGLNELERIPDYLIHLSIGIVTFFLLLSMLFSVLALAKIINTQKIQKISIEYIKANNNKMVVRIKISIIFFMIALFTVFVSAISLGIVYYLLPIFQSESHSAYSFKAATSRAFRYFPCTRLNFCALISRTISSKLCH